MGKTILFNPFENPIFDPDVKITHLQHRLAKK